MLKRLIIILLLIPVLTLTAPSKVESYSAENVIPQEALKASGAAFDQIKIVIWIKYKNERNALDLKEKWQSSLTQNSFFTGKIIIQPKTHYIIADIKSNQFNADFITLKNIFSRNASFTTKPYQSIVYKGSFEGQIDERSREKIISKIIRLSAAKKIDSYSDKQSYFWSGYTDLIKNDVNVEDNKININIAMRYNAIEDKTYIFIGTPIITIEY